MYYLLIVKNITTFEAYSRREKMLKSLHFRYRLFSKKKGKDSKISELF